ncbi:hypothetical protein MRX96_047292 [Rhipicephalus microplus]
MRYDVASTALERGRRAARRSQAAPPEEAAALDGACRDRWLRRSLDAPETAPAWTHRTVNGNGGDRAEPAYIPVTHENDVAVQQRETPRYDAGELQAE